MTNINEENLEATHAETFAFLSEDLLQCELRDLLALMASLDTEIAAHAQRAQTLAYQRSYCMSAAAAVTHLYQPPYVRSALLLGPPA